MADWPAFATKRAHVQQLPRQVPVGQVPVQHPAPQPPVQQPVTAPATPPQRIEHKQPERVRRDELSKKLELRREEIKAEKKERAKKQLEAKASQDSE